MVSEILLHFAYIQELGPILIQKGLLSLILDLQSSILNQSTEALILVKEALINLAQTGAKLMIKTNPTLVPNEHIEGVTHLIVRSLISDECHHELLQFEGLLALTNISAKGDYK